MKIRPERPPDAAAIRAVLVEAFGGDEEATLVERLREGSGLYLSLVAEEDRELVGHILFTEVTIDKAPADGLAVGLAPMAVLPAQQRRGVGVTLVKAGLEACRARGASLIVVLGHPEYYPRFGFARADRMGLAYEDPVPPEAFMAMALKPEGERFSGTVRYRPEFQAVTGRG